MYLILTLFQRLGLASNTHRISFIVLFFVVAVFDIVLQAVPMFNMRCHDYNKLGHLARVCKSKKQKKVQWWNQQKNKSGRPTRLKQIVAV